MTLADCVCIKAFDFVLTFMFYKDQLSAVYFTLACLRETDVLTAHGWWDYRIRKGILMQTHVQHKEHFICLSLWRCIYSNMAMRKLCVYWHVPSMQLELMPISLLVWNGETLPKYCDDHAAIWGSGIHCICFLYNWKQRE